jgi:transketolase
MNILTNKYDLFIFDLNNTIVNVENYHYKAWLLTLQNILGSELIFSFDYFCDHFHPKDSESIKNYLFNKFNLCNYEEIMEKKNNIYLNLLKNDKNNIKLIDGFLELINFIIAHDKKFIIVSDTYKNNIDFILDLYPILNKAYKIYYRELINRKFDKNLYIQIYHDHYFTYKKIIYFTFYIIVIDALYDKDIDLYYINNYAIDPYYSTIKDEYKILCFKNYKEVFNYNLENKIINTLRILSNDMINKANSGHPGSTIGCAAIMYVLWYKIMNYNPKNPLLYNRDRFILSNGHACAILYVMLYLLQYNYSLQDLQNFRQLYSITPGHPKFNPKLGIEVTTGPLGQGIANGVGMAIASKKLNYDNKIFVMCGDGDLMEGISYEACSLAGHLELNNLILLYDNNKTTIDGHTNLTFTENIKKRFKAQNWNFLEVINGDTDIDDIYNKLILACQSNKPTLISVHTTIGYGSLQSGTNLVHGVPLGKKNTIEFKKFFNFNTTKNFHIDDDVWEFFNQLSYKKSKLNLLNSIYIDHFNYNFISSKLDILKNNTKAYATRDLSNFCLNILDKYLDNVIIGSADLAESTRLIIESNYITKNNFKGKYIHFGIREHAMAAIANGLSTFGFIPIISTFLIFTNYCLASIRLAAISQHKVIYILTHDSMFIGQDGETHIPVESLSILRSIPHTYVFRPCDIKEVVESLKISLKYNGPSCLILSRQTIPYIPSIISHDSDIHKGAYIIYKNLKRKNLEENKTDVILIGTGSEIHLCIDIAKELVNYNIIVVSMVCTQLFDQQTDTYKKSILPPKILKISLEAGSTICWYKYVDYAYGINDFGFSGTSDDLKKHFKFTVKDIEQFIIKKLN